MMRLSEVALATNGELIGQDVEIDSVGTDSRAIKPGQLFVALKGENFDGHQHVAESLEKGAKAALVENEENTPSVKVGNTRLALGNLAAYWRQKIKVPVIGITGSNGKTTVKEMLAGILKAQTGQSELVLVTEGNLNNDIGMPLTLLKAKPSHDYVVLEMGMNHSGEIAYLSHIARPNIVLINNAGSAHIGELGSLDAIAKAKGEIFEGLDENGIAIINADDVYFDFWKSLVPSHQKITFGLSVNADVTASYQLSETHTQMSLKTAKGEVSFELPVAGEHNVKNALAASAIAIALNVSLEKIADGLSGFTGAKGRLQEKQGQHGASVIDDTYNANPVSMKAAIDVLAMRAGRRLFVMGDMGELGRDADSMHAEVGAYAKRAGIQALYAMGVHSQKAVEAFGDGAKNYETIDALSLDLLSGMNKNTTILIKGSRFMQMERVVQQIVKQKNGEKT
jgi:UDP-N-acetylmuramoyl-tripeptide--D-alanyl-D-alanine ligase